uniref:Uncharacterized protein n=1 Tax=Tetradesmus obliquus TaxID=3088 RepID=A0A383VBI5_TETOB|eukprot:jgi/Sobl393_1/16335/SZX62122.1
MEQNQLLDCIDIRLVKEQLLLLGHEVSDDVILSFVKGLAGGGAEQQCADGGAAGTTYQEQQQRAGASSSCKQTRPSSSSRVQAAGCTASSVPSDKGSGAASTLTAAAAAAQQVVTDAPCRSQLADQQSPKRALHDVGSPAAVPQVGLDQRCRKFLARLADRHSTQQQQQQPMLPGARSRASLTDLSDSDGDQEQAGHSPLTHHKGFEALHTTAGAAGASSATGADAGFIQQHLAGAVGALDIQEQHQAQWQEQLSSGGSSMFSHQPQRPGLRSSVLDAGSDVVFEVQPGGSSDSLPRFGFRPGYKPVGIHMPPPPGQDTLALMQQTSGSRSSRAGNSTAAAPPGRSALEAADCAQLQGGSPASRLLASEQQQQQQQQALQQLASKVHHHVALARSSPGLRASSESIISEANPGGGSSCHDARSRRVSKDGSGPSDPLYRAPVSPTEGAGGSCSSRQAASGGSPAAGAATASAAGGSKPRSLVFEQPAGVPGPSAGNRQVVLTRQHSFSRAPTTSSRGSVAPSTAGSYGGVSSGSSSSAGSSSSLSRYCQQLSWSSGRSTAMAPGVRKTDRVARFQKMQQAWQKDRYLNTGASRKGPSGISSSRPATTPSVRSKPSWED